MAMLYIGVTGIGNSLSWTEVGTAEAEFSIYPGQNLKPPCL